MPPGVGPSTIGDAVEVGERLEVAGDEDHTRELRERAGVLYALRVHD